MTLGCPSIPTQLLMDPGSSASALPSQIPASSAIPGVEGFIPPLLLPPPTLPSEQGDGDHAAEDNSWQLQILQIKIRKINAEVSVTTEKSNMCCNSQMCTKHQRQCSLIPSLLPSSTRGGFILMNVLNAHTGVKPCCRCRDKAGVHQSQYSSLGRGKESPTPPASHSICTAAGRELAEPVPGDMRQGPGRAGVFMLGKLMSTKLLLSPSHQRAPARIVTACSALSCRVRVICLQILPRGTSPL